MIYGGSAYGALEFGGEPRTSSASGVATPSGVSAASSENAPLGIAIALPNGVTESSAKHNPTGNATGTPSGVAAASAFHAPHGAPSGIVVGQSATSAINAPSVLGTGPGYGRGLYGEGNYGETATSSFGGAPRPFFSYSGERLAWSERPLVAKVVPLTPAPKLVIAGTVNAVQSAPKLSAQATTRLVAAAAVAQRPSFDATGVYVPLKIVGSASCEQVSPYMMAEGEMIDVELEAFAFLLAAA